MFRVNICNNKQELFGMYDDNKRNTVNNNKQHCILSKKKKNTVVIVTGQGWCIRSVSRQALYL